MKEVVVNLKDKHEMNDVLASRILHDSKGGIKKTRITITDHDTGELLGSFENKVLISGGQMTACKQWGLDAEVAFPTYNEVLNLENTLDYSTVQPKNEPIVCLFAIGNNGAASAHEVFPVRYTERIEPENLLPFRYVDPNSDLNVDQRDVYFGRVTDEETGKIKYYFKAFDTEPQLHLRYLDGTQITEDLYSIDSSQAAECYVETRLRVTRQDFRDYFEQVLGWENAVINSLSLLFAWFDPDIDEYRWYQQIIPFTRLNFPNIWLTDLTKAVDFNYQVYY